VTRACQRDARQDRSALGRCCERSKCSASGRLDLAPTVAAPSAAPRPLGLTSREEEVLSLVARGYTDREIAETLVISAKTASVHVSHILGKLGVPNRREAAAIAHRLDPPA
jgi:DNA-binding NarL/FixJ family response regulator